MSVLQTLLNPLRRRWDARQRERRRMQMYRSARCIVIGSSDVKQPSGWLATHQQRLDVTKRGDFAQYWQPGSCEVFLAEHVWEHLTPEQAALGARYCFEFLRPGGRLRLAVPDGYFQNAEYLEHVRPGGSGPGADDHKVLWTVESLTSVLEKAGFRVEPLEFWDAAGAFHANPWSAEFGAIHRTSQNDPRNRDGTLRYTSLLLDGLKPA